LAKLQEFKQCKTVSITAQVEVTNPNSIIYPICPMVHQLHLLHCPSNSQVLPCAITLLEMLSLSLLMNSQFILMVWGLPVYFISTNTLTSRDISHAKHTKLSRILTLISTKYIVTKGITFRQDAIGHNVFNEYTFRYISLYGIHHHWEFTVFRLKTKVEQLSNKLPIALSCNSHSVSYITISFNASF
jgi:hypothetical protein